MQVERCAMEDEKTEEGRGKREERREKRGTEDRRKREK